MQIHSLPLGAAFGALKAHKPCFKWKSTNHRRLASRTGGVWKNESLNESFWSRWANKVKRNAYYKNMKVFFELECMSTCCWGLPKPKYEPFITHNRGTLNLGTSCWPNKPYWKMHGNRHHSKMWTFFKHLVRTRKKSKADKRNGKMFTQHMESNHPRMNVRFHWESNESAFSEVVKDDQFFRTRPQEERSG